MMKNILLLLTIVSILCGSCLRCQTYEKPNLFIFLADDLSKSDLGCTGNPFVMTPNVDAFADGAIEFTQMYTPTAMCAPSRSALYTGCYPHRNGCHMNHGDTYDDIQSLPKQLKALGYQVVLVNKGHIKPKHVYPFDYVKTEALNDYLRDVKSPVCIIFASDEPHGPHQNKYLSPDSVIIPPKWLDTHATREALAGYYNDIELMDIEFSNFLEGIKKHQLNQNSITIFTSDHGNGFFAKWSCYEAGLKVPFYLRSEGIDFPVKEVNSLSSFIDVLPSFIELAGGNIYDTIDGESFIHLLQGDTVTNHRYIYGAHTTRGVFSGKAYPIRSVCDGHLKYIMNFNSEGKFQNIMTNGWNFGDENEAMPEWKEWITSDVDTYWVNYYQNRPDEELYFLDEDPNEMNNITDNPQFREEKMKLKHALLQWMKSQNDEGMQSELMVPLKYKKSE